MTGVHHQTLYTTSRSGPSNNSSEIQQLLHARQHLTLPRPNLETESPRCQSAVGSLEAQGAKISRLRGMIEVERQKIKYSTDRCSSLESRKLRLSPNLSRSEEVLAELQARCNKIWQYLEPTQCRRDDVNLSSEREWMRMEENQPELSFAAASDRLHDNPTSSFSTTCPGDPRQFRNFPVFLSLYLTWGSENERLA